MGNEKELNRILIDEAELIIRRFVNHAKIHSFPSQSFKEKVRRYLASVRSNADNRCPYNNTYTEKEVRRLCSKAALINLNKENILEEFEDWFNKNKKR